MKHWLKFFQRVFEEWNTDKVTRLAASLSYYTIFSLAPLLIIVIAIAGFVAGADVVQQQIISQLRGLVGQEGAQLIDTMLNNARDLGTNILAIILGVGAIVLGATGVVGELKDSLNTIWNVTPKPGNGLFGTLRERILSFGMVLGIGFLLLVSLVISASLATLNASIRGYFQGWTIIAQMLDVLISFGSVTLLFALLFKFLPDARVTWRDVWIGAGVTALLFTLGKYALGLYLGSSGVATPFGAAGSLVILLVWVYYAAQILFLGAEITQVYANEYGAGVRPKADATKLSDAARVEQGTRAPTPPDQPKENLKREPIPEPLYAALPHRSYKTRGAFNPLGMLGGAIGVRVFGWLKKLFSLTSLRSRHAHE